MGLAGMPGWPVELMGPNIPGLSFELDGSIYCSGELGCFGPPDFDNRPVAVQLYESLTQ